MFTGIITAVGKVKKIQKVKKFFLIVETDGSFAKKAGPGSSIAVDGVCLTLMKIGKNSPRKCHSRASRVETRSVLIFELMPETVRLTIAGEYKIGSIVNLENPLRIGDELGGHFVSGHIDGVGEIIKIKKEKRSIIMTIRPPRELSKYLAHKGSVAINGVSLTLINPPALYDNVSKIKTERCSAFPFNVSLVTYTLENTNLSNLRVGSKVNIEVDLLARYLKSLMDNK